MLVEQEKKLEKKKMTSSLATPPSLRETVINSFSLILRTFLSERKVTSSEARQRAYGV